MMLMKTFFNVVLFSLAVSYNFAQISFNTGDKELEVELNLFNTEAKKDLAKFKENTAKEYSLSKETIQSLLDKKMQPAEILLSIRISLITKKPVVDVVKCYEKNKSKGWGAIAKEMGIKPGSPEFHALKGKSKNGKPAEKKNDDKGKPADKGKKKE